MFLELIHHSRKVQDGAADSIQFIDDNTLYLATADFLKHLLKLWAIRIFAAVSLVCIGLVLPTFHLLLAIFNLALNRDAVYPVNRLPGVDCVIFFHRLFPPKRKSRQLVSLYRGSSKISSCDIFCKDFI